MPEVVNEEREQRILDAAVNLIVHYGYAKTTVEDIAREAGVSKGAIYLHYKSKDELFEQLLLRETGKVTEQLYERIDADPGGITLFTIYRHSLLLVAENPLLRALYARDKRILGDYLRKKNVAATLGQNHLFGTQFIKTFQDAGLIRRDLRPEAIMYLLSSIRYGFLMVDDAIDIGETPSFDELGEAVSALLEDGFAARGTGDQEKGRQALLELLEYGRAALRQLQHKD